MRLLPSHPHKGVTALWLVLDRVPETRRMWWTIRTLWSYVTHISFGSFDQTANHHHHHNRFTALFPGPLGWIGARRELLDFMVQGEIDHPAGRHSIQTNQCPPPPSRANQTARPSCVSVCLILLWLLITAVSVWGLILFFIPVSSSEVKIVFWHSRVIMTLSCWSHMSIVVLELIIFLKCNSSI